MDTFAVMFLEPTMLLTVVTIGLICWFLLRDSNHRLPPGPTPWPILGVIFGNGEQHSTLRKFSMGAFREFGLGGRSLEEKIQIEAKCLCDLMREQNGKPSDNFMTFKKAVSNVISNIIYGTRNDYDDPDFLKAIECIDVFFTTSSAGSPENFLPFLDKLPYSRAPRIYKAMVFLEQYAHKKIDEHRKTFDPNYIRDFVDIFLEHEKETKGAFTEDNLFRIIVDFYNAGTDTTALTIHWTILFLLKNPRVQQKLRQQINEVVGDSEVCMAHRDSLPYLQAVIHETLRMACIGSRSCLGKQLAKTELFLFLGSLFQQFEFKYPGDPTKLSTRIHQTGETSQSDQYDVCAVPARA